MKKRQTRAFAIREEWCCECVMEKGGEVLKGSLEGVVANTNRRTPKFPGLGRAKPKIAELQSSPGLLQFWGTMLEDFGGLLRGGCFFESFLSVLGLKAPPKPQLNSVEFGAIRWKSRGTCFADFWVILCRIWPQVNSVEFGGIRWNSVEFGGIRWNSVEFGGIRWNSVGIRWGIFACFCTILGRIWPKHRQVNSAEYVRACSAGLCTMACTAARRDHFERCRPFWPCSIYFEKLHAAKHWFFTVF